MRETLHPEVVESEDVFSRVFLSIPTEAQPGVPEKVLSGKFKETGDWRVKKTCPVCGQEFETEKSNKKYCSFACAGEAKYVRDLAYVRRRRKTDPEFRQRYKKYYHWEPKPRRYTKCVVCGKEIPETRSKIAKTCSEECSRKRHKQVHDEWCRTHPDGAYYSRRPKREPEPLPEPIGILEVINPECGIPCSECELDYCPYE